MAKTYTKGTWEDEVLSSDEKYQIKDDSGNVVYSGAQITLSTPVLQAGTAASAARMNNIENGIDAVDTRLSTLLDGWIDPAETWVYVSGTSFKIAGVDRTTMFTKGTKIKLTQSATVKYFYVISASYTTDTTVTISGGSDYTLANATISSPYYSYASTPQGFPHYFNYAPTFGASGSMTFIDVTTTFARFAISGNTVHIEIKASGTTGGTASNALTATLPVPAAQSSNTVAISGYTSPGANSVAGFAFIGAGNIAYVRAYDSQAFTLTTGKILSISGVYSLG